MTNLAQIYRMLVCFMTTLSFLPFAMRLRYLTQSRYSPGFKRLGFVVLGSMALGTIAGVVGAQTTNPFSFAADHAGMAAEAKDLPEIHQHLQHVLNCLEGSTGKDYNNVAENPCTGKGALQTLSKGSTNLVRSEKAIDLARVGMTLHDVPPADYVAQSCTCDPHRGAAALTHIF